VLILKIRKDKVNFKYLSSKVTINEDVLDGIRDKVVQKLIGRTRGNIDLIDID
jgi:hypothetical protein